MTHITGRTEQIIEIRGPRNPDWRKDLSGTAEIREHELDVGLLRGRAGIKPSPTVMCTDLKRAGCGSNYSTLVRS